MELGHLHQLDVDYVKEYIMGMVNKPKKMAKELPSRLFTCRYNKLDDQVVMYIELVYQEIEKKINK
jgi:hypothetical protein